MAVEETAAAQATIAAAAATAAAPAPAVEPETTAAPAAPETPAPGPAPWAKSLETRFADETVRAEVDAYLREEHQPYVTKVEQERAEALDKARIYDWLDEEPDEALKAIVSAVYDDEAAERVAELIGAGVAPEKAAEVAGAEAEAAGVQPAELPEDVKATVEWAKKRQAEESAEAEAKQIEDAGKALKDWHAELVKADPDIKYGALMAYVAAQQGDMDAALAAYRVDFPAPKTVVEPPPPKLGGHAHGGIEPSRRMGSLAQAAGSVFDAARGMHLDD